MREVGTTRTRITVLLGSSAGQRSGERAVKQGLFGSLGRGGGLDRGARGNGAVRMHSVEPGRDRRVCGDSGVFDESFETPLMEFRSPRRTKGSGSGSRVGVVVCIICA
jgi:hypothetical protein